MQENKTKVKTKKNKNKKFKAIYLVPVIFLLVALIVGLSVFQSLFQDGPIYGDRCAGITEIASADVDAVESSIPQEHSEVKHILIEVNCKTIAIDLEMNEGTSKEDISEVCEAILTSIDTKVGLSKSNSESKYSDLFGTYNGKMQYHVDFTIEGTEEIYPIFASKHPASDEINYTYNEARNPDLVDELTSEE